MKQATIQTAHQKIEEMIFEQHGVKMIGLGCYCLDFKNNYAFLGFTKKGDKVILGDDYSSGPDGIKYRKRYGKIEERVTHQLNEDRTSTIEITQIRLVTDGYRYSETLFEVKN